jgi:multicomponent Na+:H+ antiporter subunit G
MIGEFLMLVGALLTLVSAIGVVRFSDALARMHALTKASTVGFGFVAIGACLLLTNANDLTSVLLAAGLQILTLPVAASLIARSTYWARRIPLQIDEHDELQQAAQAARLGRPRFRLPQSAAPLSPDGDADAGDADD